MLVSGCDSTQDQSRRAKLQATRELAGRRPVEVIRGDPEIAVVRVRLVAGGKRSSAVADSDSEDAHVMALNMALPNELFKRLGVPRLAS